MSYSANVLSAATTVGLEMPEYPALESNGSVSVRVTMRGNSSDVVTVTFNTVSQTATGIYVLFCYKIACITLPSFLSLFHSTI